MNSPSIERLRLGLFGLEASESRYLQALMRLIGSSSRDFPWVLSDQTSLDAVLIDPRYADPMDPVVRNLGRHMLIISDANPLNQPGILARPIQLEKFEAWLGQQAERLRGDIELSSLPTMSDAGDRNRDDAEDSRRYRLLRWPPAALLQRDARRIRMATLMSKRALTSAELARSIQEPSERCMVFLKLLQSFDLVEIIVQPSAALPVPAEARAKTPAAVEHRHSPAPPRGLVSSIRRRLGL